MLKKIFKRELTKGEKKKVYKISGYCYIVFSAVTYLKEGGIDIDFNNKTVDVSIHKSLGLIDQILPNGFIKLDLFGNDLGILVGMMATTATLSYFLLGKQLSDDSENKDYRNHSRSNRHSGHSPHM